MIFVVIDKETGKEADPYDIALHEAWAKDLMYCDMEGFAILEDGTLILTDECGKYEFCPEGRFVVIKMADLKNNPPLTWDEILELNDSPVWLETKCGNGWGIITVYNYGRESQDCITFVTNNMRMKFDMLGDRLPRFQMGDFWQAFKYRR